MQGDYFPKALDQLLKSLDRRLSRAQVGITNFEFTWVYNLLDYIFNWFLYLQLPTYLARLLLKNAIPFYFHRRKHLWVYEWL